MSYTAQARSAWENRFRCPGHDELVEHYPKLVAALFTHARQRLIALDGPGEVLAWHGVPWRWSYAYRLSGEDSSAPAFAYLVPMTPQPVISLPIRTSQAGELPLKKLSKFVRDGVLFASDVGGLLWAQWELTSKTQADEIVDLAARKLALSASELRSAS